MGKLANLVGYQAVWFCAVLGAANGAAWPGVLAATVFVVAQWLASKERVSDLRLLACALAVGLALDGSLAQAGVLRHAVPTAGLPAPAWILAIWAAFALTLNHSMAFLRGRPGWAAVLGAVGGPIAYAGAARGFDVLQYPAGPGPALAALAIGWALALPLLVSLAHRWRAQPRPSAVAALERP